MHDNEDDSLARERENFTLWIKQPVECTHFLAGNSSNANNEDIKRELQTINEIFLHADPLKYFQE